MIADEEVRLTQMSKTAGCAAKIGPGTLAGILESLPKFQDENLLVGIETSDDGAIYKVSDEVALIQTLDFFTPVVDDPYTFGQVAAANALSDIYAMGGEPKVALNIVAWPNCVNPKFLGEILRGGAGHRDCEYRGEGRDGVAGSAAGGYPGDDHSQQKSQADH